jgi:hypothetical protein
MRFRGACMDSIEVLSWRIASIKKQRVQSSVQAALQDTRQFRLSSAMQRRRATSICRH